MPYIPIVRTKAGELNAFKYTTQEIVQHLLPCFELQPVNWDQSTVAVNATNWAKKLKKAWSWETRCILDLTILDGTPLLTPTLQALAQDGPVFTPVVTPLSSPAFHNAVAPYAADGRGVCLRLKLGATPPIEEITTILNNHGSGFPKNLIDVILDYGAHTSIPQWQVPAAVQVINALPFLQDYRCVALAATTFPENMSRFQQGVSQSPREEWLFWQAITTQQTLQRKILFSDYTAAYPGEIDFNFQYMQTSAKIKYTADTYWLIVKGQSTKGRGFGQCRALSQILMQQPEYCGSGFSWGDAFIYQCAHGGKTGNSTSWVSVAVNHHLAFVVDQLSRLGAL